MTTLFATTETTATSEPEPGSGWLGGKLWRWIEQVKGLSGLWRVKRGLAGLQQCDRYRSRKLRRPREIECTSSILYPL